MSDLRTRIADAIKAADNDYAIDQTNAYLNMADAVIRELGLTKKLDANRSVPQLHYVTPWEKA